MSQFVVLQVDILCRALHKEEEGHLLCAFPTGYGKSLPMLLLGLLMPEGRAQNLKLVIVLPQISPTEFEAAMARRPKLLVCSVEFLADS